MQVSSETLPQRLAICKRQGRMPMVSRKTVPPKPREARSECPVSRILDVVGDRWTLLVVRDVMMFGKHRFGELAGSREGIPTNILTDRLRRLEKWGILEK